MQCYCFSSRDSILERIMRFVLHCLTNAKLLTTLYFRLLPISKRQAEPSSAQSLDSNSMNLLLLKSVKVEINQLFS